MDDSLDGNDAGGEHDSDLGGWCLRGDDGGDIGGIWGRSGSSNRMDLVSM